MLRKVQIHLRKSPTSHFENHDVLTWRQKNLKLCLHKLKVRKKKFLTDLNGTCLVLYPSLTEVSKIGSELLTCLSHINNVMSTPDVLEKFVESISVIQCYYGCVILCSYRFPLYI